ncbi:PilZ domain-containing protein [Thalassoroseus pseudoceratinae]|uniref:PilZ domain-containing protein n=1 Tax=Thalassoroseus pseudoceratinae TaxID=2713176 RepID=UPI00141F8504|nr:PilZ domain-containing protein [Thalassoroseus pseudoceratinae]
MDEIEALHHRHVGQSSGAWWTRLPNIEFVKCKLDGIGPLTRVHPDMIADALLAVDGRPTTDEPLATSNTEHPPQKLIQDAEIAQPEAEIAQPEAEITQPEAEITQPEAEITQPEAEIAQGGNDWEPFVERRVLPRRTGNASVRVVRIPADSSLTSQQRNWELYGTSLRCELEEISLQSLVCLLGEPFSPGDTVYVRLENPRTHRTLDVPAEVARVRFVSGDDRWKVIFELQRSLTLSELQHFAYASEQPLPIGDLEEAQPDSSH